MLKSMYTEAPLGSTTLNDKDREIAHAIAREVLRNQQKGNTQLGKDFKD